MSDLRPEGIRAEIAGQERNLLLNINAIDQIQAKCNMPLYDAIGVIAEAADGNTERETLLVYRAVLAALLEAGGEQVTEEEAGNMVTFSEYGKIAWKMLEAYGIFMPEPEESEEDEEDQEDEDPNRETGR